MQASEAFRLEREALRTTLAGLGPDRSAGCGTWTTADLAVHIVLGEWLAGFGSATGRGLVAKGVHLDWMAPLIDAMLRRARARRDFAWAMEKLGREPPHIQCRSLLAPVSLLEVWAHHEDVLAANGLGACDSGADLRPALSVLVRYQHKLLAKHGVRVGSDDGTMGWHEPVGPHRVSVCGAVEPLARWLSGRASLDALAVTGDPLEIEQLRGTRLRL